MKKSLLVLLIVIAIINTQAQTDNRWTKVGETNESIYYINNKRTFIKVGRIKVWVKKHASEDEIDFSGLLEEKDSRGKSMSVQIGNRSMALDKTLLLYELNCSQEQFRIISLVEYKSGKVEHSENWNNSLWNYIVPDSVGEAIFQQGCREQKWKKKKN